MEVWVSRAETARARAFRQLNESVGNGRFTARMNETAKVLQSTGLEEAREVQRRLEGIEQAVRQLLHGIY